MFPDRISPPPAPQARPAPGSRMALWGEDRGRHPRVPAQGSIPPTPPGPALPRTAPRAGMRPPRPLPQPGEPRPRSRPRPRSPALTERAGTALEGRRGEQTEGRREESAGGAGPTRTHIPLPGRKRRQPRGRRSGGPRPAPAGPRAGRIPEPLRGGRDGVTVRPSRASGHGGVAFEGFRLRS